ncbi:MAG: gliding motility-associated ABC transporter substrate-binding protein GldG [Bacteroidales bacterium]|nr:gliding motility-associated ABC transporter substrate-binding protein GldG [Bacteroidales bacterium]
MKNRKKLNLRLSNLLEFLAVLLVIVSANIIGSIFFTRFDLTAEKRYTLSDSTKDFVKQIDEQLMVRVYLDGDDLPAEYRRFRNEIKEMLEEFRAYNKNVEYEFFDPYSLESDTARIQLYIELNKKSFGSVQPLVVSKNDEGKQTQLEILPAIEISYKGRETAIQLQSMEFSSTASVDEIIRSSIENLEYNFVLAVHRLMRPEAARARIGFLTGHGELERAPILDIQLALVNDYIVDNVDLSNYIGALASHVQYMTDSSIHINNRYDILVVPKPLREFSDMEIYLLDQYVMYGGKVLWLIDALDADMDSLAHQPQAFATRLPTNLDNLFYNYGFRVKPDLIMDYKCREIKLIGNDGSWTPHKWLYFPTIKPRSNHVIVRNLDEIKTDFISSIELIDNDIKKTILLSTSDHVHLKNAPVEIRLSEIDMPFSPQFFNKRDLPVAVLLEGQFKSLFRERLTEEFTALKQIGYKSRCDKPTQMIVVSDGDMIRNDYFIRRQTRLDDQQTGGLERLPLGFDRNTGVMFANKTFILNAINYLAGDEMLINARPRKIMIRRLDEFKIKENKTRYQISAICFPILIVLLIAAGVISYRYVNYRKGKGGKPIPFKIKKKNKK